MNPSKPRDKAKTLDVTLEFKSQAYLRKQGKPLLHSSQALHVSDYNRTARKTHSKLPNFSIMFSKSLFLYE